MEVGGGANGKNTLPVLLYFHHGSRQHVSPRDTARGEKAHSLFSHVSCCAVTIQNTQSGPMNE